MGDTRLQLSDYKKKADENEELVGRLEDLKKRNMKELVAFRLTPLPLKVTSFMVLYFNC